LGADEPAVADKGPPDAAFGVQARINIKSKFYLCECPELPEEAELDGADIGGADMRGCEIAAFEARERDVRPPPLAIGANPGAGIAAMCSVTTPRACAFCDSLAMLSKCPRGTPRPAELARMTNLPPVVPARVELGPRFTITVPVPLVGA